MLRKNKRKNSNIECVHVYGVQHFILCFLKEGGVFRGAEWWIKGSVLTSPIDIHGRIECRAEALLLLI